MDKTFTLREARQSMAAADPLEQNTSSSRLLTADELAERWQVPTAHVYRLGREGRVPVVRIGRYFRFRLASIEAWECAQEGASDA
jgi:excisionase family DNA binding protein